MQRTPTLMPVNMQPTNAMTFSVLCGTPGVIDAFEAFMGRQGLRSDPDGRLVIILDLPRGFAPYTLGRLHQEGRQVIVVTWSTCPEYCEDLWDLRPDGLIVGDGISLELMTAITRVTQGERYRLTPPSNTLTPVERRMLRLLAHGHTNQQIAQQVSMQVQTVKNTLATIYRKLDLKNRSEALLYYWSIWHTFTEHNEPFSGRTH